MGAKTKLDIETDQLHSAAGKAGQTLAGSVIPTIPPPPPTTASQLDIALASISAQSELLRSKVDTVDTTWATKQQAALTESPPVLQEQDTQAAGDYERNSQFPTPEVKPPIGPPDTGSVQPAGYSPALPENGPWGLDDDEWELDPWGTPQPIWPNLAAAPAAEQGRGLALRAASRQSRRGTEQDQGEQMSIAPPPAYPTWPPQPYPPAPQKPRRRWPAIAAAAGIGAIVAGSITTLITFAATSPEPAHTAAPAPSTVTETAGPPPSPAPLPVAEADAQTCRAWQTTDTLVTAAAAQGRHPERHDTSPTLLCRPTRRGRRGVLRASDLYGQAANLRVADRAGHQSHARPESQTPPSARCAPSPRRTRRSTPPAGIPCRSSKPARRRSIGCADEPQHLWCRDSAASATTAIRDTRHSRQVRRRSSGRRRLASCSPPALSVRGHRLRSGGDHHSAGSRYHRPAPEALPTPVTVTVAAPTPAAPAASARLRRRTARPARQGCASR